MGLDKVLATNTWSDKHPYIYAKVMPSAQTVLILDTGCGGASNNHCIGVKSLREFLRNVGVLIVVQSHCHYDYILGMEAFASDSVILGSEHDPTFASPENLPAHSLCESLGIRTPESMLYVGDTLYEDDPIIFPEEGNLPDWFSTVDDLLAFVSKQSDPNNDVVSGTESPRRRFNRRGQWVVEYKQMSGRFSLICPERLVSQARKAMSI
ncbi:Metallo-hydrolase oxidoreductase [Pisolithus orientalis]|uniref:Metallo-hydrolase oxidoreductase n=1 Tax=Pisolithus orientalis TaxID=936130 RepID=UPI002224A67F|nr:Metallo-hydrolase oxidoreductase [Pisolithus orientalis]KAI6008169.1 Metallo-hydrolase oxidoreductase [Pisolithus orientalis]